MRTKKGVKELITGIIIGEGLKMTDLEEKAVDRIIEALTEENNLFIPDVGCSLPTYKELSLEAEKYQDKQLDDPHALSYEAFIDGGNYVHKKAMSKK
jgi:hypothetical protein